MPVTDASTSQPVPDTVLVDLLDDDLAAMLRGDALVRDGLAPAPGGVDVPAVLVHVRAIAAALRARGYHGGQWMIAVAGEVVGLIGYKHPPTPGGEVEIGYGVAASRRCRGHATRAVAAVVAQARRDPAIRAVLAQTVPDNAASQGVLRRNGFEQTGTRFDPGDGELLVWRIAVAEESASAGRVADLRTRRRRLVA